MWIKQNQDEKRGGGALLTFNCFFLIFNTKKCFLVTEMMNNISFCWKSRIIQFLKLWSNYQYLNLWEKIESHGHAVSISTIHAFSSSHPSLFIYLFLTGIKKEHLFPFYTCNKHTCTFLNWSRWCMNLMPLVLTYCWDCNWVRK